MIVKREPMSLNVSRLVGIIGGKREKIIRKSFDLGAMIVYFLSLGRIVISPSIFVIARKRREPKI